jgi:hypothetical protein
MTAPLDVIYQLGGSADFTIPAAVDASAGSCPDRVTRAFASVSVSSTNEISRASITYCGSDIAETTGTIAHELGHTLGFWHSLDAHDMMYPYSVSSSSTAPTAREGRTFGLMRARRAGTVWPDNDRTTTAAARARVETIVD